MVFLFVAIIQGVPEKMFVCEINMINMYELLIFLDFLKGTKFGTSRPHFSLRNRRLKKVRADSAPPPP